MQILGLLRDGPTFSVSLYSCDQAVLREGNARKCRAVAVELTECELRALHMGLSASFSAMISVLEQVARQPTWAAGLGVMDINALHAIGDEACQAFSAAFGSNAEATQSLLRKVAQGGRTLRCTPQEN